MKLKLKISGAKVHDVGYRAFLLEVAEDLGLIGFSARNTIEDSISSVLVCLDGGDAAMAKFQQIAGSQKPDKAEVSSIAFSDYGGQVENIDVFAGRFQARQLRKGISAIIRMEDKQDQMLDKQDQMLEKQDQMLEKQSQMLDKQDQMILLQSKTIDKLDETKDVIVDEIVKSRDAVTEKLDENLKVTVKAIRDSSDAVIEELRESRDGTLEDIRDLRTDLRSSLEKKIGRMEKDISQLKARSGA
ncbi:MAG: acylphosphatase [Methanothrix sp.]